MPATQPTSDPPPPPSKGKTFLFVGLALFICAGMIFLATLRRRRRAQLRAAQPPPPSSQPVPEKPVCHDVHLSGITAKPTWDVIQPFALETPFPPRAVPRGGRWSTLKRQYRPTSRPSLFSSSDASLLNPALIGDLQTLPVAQHRHLQIAVMIAMPLPPELDASEDASRAIPYHRDADMAVGIMTTPFPP
ncbi:hypothetical protein B0H10DRAFT_2434463 [Mycena sp. CBHHK59/15]|nr:hypothetical protein B0H10DRAFT_2434463 [Mycena sp. CBHHK59/15]